MIDKNEIKPGLRFYTVENWSDQGVYIEYIEIHIVYNINDIYFSCSYSSHDENWNLISKTTNNFNFRNSFINLTEAEEYKKKILKQNLISEIID